jgi:hypothetical protein
LTVSARAVAAMQAAAQPIASNLVSLFMRSSLTSRRMRGIM